ncbi:hypothetical protein AYO40_05140 [Planctomycetaceae bacterium SCGC AG-212-D15]|nr:hypothetical protein AYO40_05140 [Planctomycetaceae bacterium SCGC AG-212-D15]
MRLATGALLAILVLVNSISAADEKADGRAIIDKAIKAVGGEEKMGQFKIESFREKGTYYGMGDGLPYTGAYVVQWPDHFRMEIEGVFVMVVAGEKGWMTSEKGVVDMTEEQLKREKRNLYGGYVATLLPLKDKAYTLTVLPEAKVADKPVVGVRVTQKDKPDVSLYFDKDTGLLAKVEQMVLPSEDPKAKEVKQETFLSEYKEIEGCKMATKVVAKRDGKVYVEAEMSDIKSLKKADEKAFAKPEAK